MANETITTVVGNLTADPELRFTPSGAAVANFTVAATPRMFDRQSGEWKDGVRGAADVLGTLLHETAHALAHVRDIKDTSRQGRWHNGPWLPPALHPS